MFSLSQTRQNQALVILLVLLLQAAYWLFYAFISEPAPIPVQQQIRNWDHASIAAPTLDAAQDAVFENRDTPFLLNVEPAEYIMIKSQFSYDGADGNDIGIGLAIGADNVHLYVNDTLVHDPGQLLVPATYHGRQRQIIRVSSGLLNPGSNTITALAVNNAAPELAVYPAILGSYSALMDATAKRRFFLNEYKQISAIIALILAIIILPLIPQTENKRLVFWLFFTCAAVAFRSGLALYYGPVGGESIRFILIFGVAALVPFGLFMFTEHWSGTQNPWPRRVGLIAALAALLTLIVIFHQNPHSKVEQADTFVDLAMLLFAAMGLVRCLLCVWAGDQRSWELATLTVANSLALVDAYIFLVPDMDANHLRVVSPAILIMLIGGILARNLRLFETLGSFNQALNRELTERTRQVENNMIQIAAMEKERSLNHERQRILRDMHDGIGSQLTGLLLQNRVQTLAPKEISESLENMLADLRLVVESIDHADGSLHDILLSLQTRTKRQCSALGIALNWSADVTEELTLDPSAKLQILRILQEALTNAIKHAQATKIDIQFKLKERPENELVIEVRDNGTGFDVQTGSASGGQGLKSMTQRAKDLGGELTIRSGPSGTGLILKCPV